MLKLKDSGLVDTNTLIILLIIVVAVIILFVPKQITIVRERKAFNHARDIVHSIGEQTAQKIKPIKQGPSDYCEYGRVKFGRGGLSCQTNYYLIYTSESAQYTKTQAADIWKVTQNMETDAKNLRILDGSNLSSEVATGFFISDMVSCGISAYYNNGTDPPTYFTNPPFEIEKNTTVIEVACSGSATKEYFPLLKD